MDDINRRNFLAASGAAILVPQFTFGSSEVLLPRKYVPEDARPYYHPRFDLHEGHVDELIWPAVKRINESGWVWTLESCQGHDKGWSEFPLLRLAVHHGQAARMLGLLHRSVPISPQKEGALRVEAYRHVPPPLPGWYETRITITRIEKGETARAECRKVFDEFAERVNK